MDREKIKKNFYLIMLLMLTGTTTFIWYAVFYFASRQNLLVTFFDVGQGDAIFIEVPGGHQILIDGGPNNKILTKLGGTLPPWDRSIDLLILTHPHTDHLAGLLEVLKRYRVEMVLETGVNYSLPEYEEWRRLLKEKKVKVIRAEMGQRIRLSPSAYLDVLSPFENFEGLSPKNVHDAMIIAKLIYASTTALFMGDAEKSLEYRLLFSGVNVASDILKVGHHGSKTSSAEEFLRAVAPQVAVIQVGHKNRYGHPAQEVLDRLAAAGAKILRNDLDGDIRIVSKGIGYEIRK